MVGEMELHLWSAMQNLMPVERAVPEDREEAGWIVRAQAGDDSAIGWLIARYRQRAVRLATHILRRPGEAEDVAQEAFVRAFRNLRSFRGEGRFYTWLYQIVVRICLDRRKLARWNAETPLDAAGTFREETTDATANRIQTRVLVETLLDRLTPPMRAMLVLRELEGLEYEEIAQALQIPVGRVKWRLHTARAQFRELWFHAMQEADHV
jgi:RNA polymerase sigma-70 factor (ECF subfamily)